jgi:hypothetical protein
LSKIQDRPNNKEETLRVTLFERIAKGELLGAGTEGLSESNKVIQTQQDWEVLVLQMNAVNTELNKVIIEGVNVDTHTVLACFDRVQGSGGRFIRIKDIKENSNQVFVWVQKLGSSSMAPSVMTQPYYIGAIPKTEKEVVFILQ